MAEIPGGAAGPSSQAGGVVIADGRAQRTGEVDLRELLAEAVTSLINLKITTMVGEARISGPIHKLDVQLPGVGASAVTNINLLDGDIANCISPAIVGGDYKDIKALHEAMVEKGQAIVERNVRLLRELLAAGFTRLGGST